MYNLIDLERSVGSSHLYYWKQNEYGYTTNLKEAGIFTEEVAKQRVNSDFDKNTAMVTARNLD